MSNPPDAKSPSPFEEVNARLDEASVIAGVPEEAMGLLKNPYREIRVQIPLYRRDRLHYYT
ncbi:MAG: hypothetical protein KAU50_01275, partial [Candidatus Marinimicrobia bacterium]|nr:hypothetical protein [Candidatus Neomarinimicrobiota bacterium]